MRGEGIAQPRLSSVLSSEGCRARWPRHWSLKTFCLGAEAGVPTDAARRSTSHQGGTFPQNRVKVEDRFPSEPISSPSDESGALHSRTTTCPLLVLSSLLDHALAFAHNGRREAYHVHQGEPHRVRVRPRSRGVSRLSLSRPSPLTRSLTPLSACPRPQSSWNGPGARSHHSRRPQAIPEGAATSA